MTSWSQAGLRVRVTAVAGLVAAVGLAAASGLLVLSLRNGLLQALDDSARLRAGDALSALRRGDVSGAVTPTTGEALVQVLTADGRVLAASPGLPLTPLAPLPLPRGTAHQPDAELPGREVRVLSVVGGDGRQVVVATPLSRMHDPVAQLVRRLLVGGPVLLALLCTALWLVVGYALMAVERMRGQVASLAGGTLGAMRGRLEVPPAQDELRQLALTMNDLLDRLAAAADVQRRFVADAAHELRTPLAALRTRVEVQQRAADVARWQASAPALLADVDRLARLVEDLLALARLDESPRRGRRALLDLDEVVLAEAARLRGGPVTLDVSGVGAALVQGDGDLLVRVVANLLANALRHAASRVVVSLRTDGGQAVLRVADDGPGIPESEREAVFERFHRLDEARSREPGGSGLGLAIVREAVQAHGGSVAVVSAGPGAVLEVRLPASVDEPVAAGVRG